MSNEPPVREEPLPDELTFEAWQQQLRAGRLLGHECDDCGWVMALPHGACDDCGGRSLTVVNLPTDGEVYSVTRVHVAPEGFEDGYHLALIDLGPARVLGRVSGDPSIGDEVTMFDVFEGTADPAPIFE
jgi:uncharacterized OB-fold protein